MKKYILASIIGMAGLMSCKDNSQSAQNEQINDTTEYIYDRVYYEDGGWDSVRYEKGGAIDKRLNK